MSDFSFDRDKHARKNDFFCDSGIYVGPATTSQIERIKSSYNAYDQIVKNLPAGVGWSGLSSVSESPSGEMKIATKYDFIPTRVIINHPATIIIWNDGTKTVVKCNKDDNYDLTTGILLCFMKKLFGNNNNYHKVLYSAMENVEWQFNDKGD